MNDAFAYLWCICSTTLMTSRFNLLALFSNPALIKLISILKPVIWQ